MDTLIVTINVSVYSADGPTDNTLFHRVVVGNKTGRDMVMDMVINFTSNRFVLAYHNTSLSGLPI